MGVVVGLMFALGVLTVVGGVGRVGSPRVATQQRFRDLLDEAGLGSVGVGQLFCVCVCAVVVVGIVVAGVTRSLVLSLVFALFAGYSPVAYVRRRRHLRTLALREHWPDVVDNLASSVRAGLSLPEAVSQLGERGPESLRPAFVRFGVEYRAAGRFGECLDRLKDELADPVADRIVEALRLARDVGGSDLGRLLRTLSQFLRDDIRTRAELETRQGWTVNAARLALAAPWIVVALLSLRPETVAAYDSVAGAALLIVGGALSFVAYRVMLRIGRLPREGRVLR